MVAIRQTSSPQAWQSSLSRHHRHPRRPRYHHSPPSSTSAATSAATAAATAATAATAEAAAGVDILAEHGRMHKFLCRSVLIRVLRLFDFPLRASRAWSPWHSSPRWVFLLVGLGGCELKVVTGRTRQRGDFNWCYLHWLTKDGAPSCRCPASGLSLDPARPAKSQSTLSPHRAMLRGIDRNVASETRTKDAQDSRTKDIHS